MKLKEKLKKELNRFINRILKHFGIEEPQPTPQETPTEPSDTPTPTQAPQPQENPSQDPQSNPTVAIESFGSPNCAKAKEDPNTQIKDLKWSTKGLSYRWAKGSLKNWGIPNDHDAGALAVTGYGNEANKMRCAKFDWISTDRLTRGFENVNGGYNGFDPKQYMEAKHHCFFIMTSDGKQRTNVLVD